MLIIILISQFVVRRYKKDGKNLGVAFRGLNNVNEELYPVVGSTAKCTRMRLVGSYRGFVSLLERLVFHTKRI